MRSIIAIISICIFFFTVLPISGETSASPYHPAQSLTVVSESIVPGSITGGSDGIFWRIVPETFENGSFCLGFYRNETGDPVCRIIPAGRNSGLYFADGFRFPNAVTTRDLMLFPGFSVPCDILPVKAACGVSEPEIIETRRQAGESTFIEKLQIECNTVTPADALAQGWIMESGEDIGALTMIQLTSLKTGENVSRQLWIPGDAWWLYEETPYRRSWRLR